jgi:hypothetical protein
MLLMTRSRLRVPSADGALLAIPPLRDSGRVLADNQSSLSKWDYDFQGRTARTLRARARVEVTELARAFMGSHGLNTPPTSPVDTSVDLSEPWVVTGHQPELFHPGVWVKNFAAAAIARKADGVSLNVIVDNDLPKSPSIMVPTVETGGIRRIGVEFDVWPDREVPFEDLAVGDEATFASFPQRVRVVLGDLVDDPVLNEFWPAAMSRRDDVTDIGLRFALARHEIESRWGAENLEVPLSALCQTDAFLWFLSHILAQLPRFQDVHNTALKDYRRLHGIRSRNHPVPALENRDGWREAPFWVWRAERPRRQPLLARQVGRQLELRIAGEQDVLAELPLGPDREACCAVEILRELPGRSVRIRTRALTTTMFCRLLLGDLFLHGIGGAKYDELGDSIARRFFGITPPVFLTLSQTLWLGLPHNPTIPGSLDSVRHRLRDADFNPDRILSEPIPDAARRMIEAKQRAIRGPQDTRRQRKARWRELYQLNASLQEYVEEQRNDLESRLHILQKGLRDNRVASNREYSLVLHSRRRLSTAMNRLGAEIEAD